jgi:hypothetical protein
MNKKQPLNRIQRLFLKTFSLLTRDNDPHQYINQDTGKSAWQKQQEKTQPKPESANSKKICQSAAHTCQHPVMA